MEDFEPKRQLEPKATDPVEGSRTTSIAPPVFRCWMGRKVSP